MNSNVHGVLGEKLRNLYPSMTFKYVPRAVLVSAKCCWSISDGGGVTRRPKTVALDMVEAVEWAERHKCAFPTKAQAHAECRRRRQAR